MSREESTRLFVGGLSQQLSEEELNQQLSNYGTVNKLEIKEKKDLCTGEVIKRFAFATLYATKSRIDQCIRSLNGKSLNGSELTIERAQESFIDRLNREREARAQGKSIDKSSSNSSSHHQQNNQNDYQFNFGGGEDTNTRYNDNGEDYSRQRPSYADREDDTFRLGSQKRGRGWEEEDKHKVPEQLFSNAVWREGGEDQLERADNQGDYQRAEDAASRFRTASPPPLKWAKIAPRYDPKKKNSVAAAPARTAAASSEAATQSGQTQPQLPKAVLVPTTVSADLTFTGASQGFSLLSMLEQADPVTVVAKDAAEVTDTTTDEKEVPQESHDKKRHAVELPPAPVVPVTEKKQPTAVKTYIKKFKFFVDVDDPEVEENLRWVYQEIPEAQLNKFRNDRPEIMKLYTDRYRKAQAELRQSLPGAGGDSTSTQTWSGEADDEGEAAVMAAYDNDGPEPVALATDTFRGAVQSVGPATESEVQDGGARRRGAGGGGRGKGRGRKPTVSGERGGRVGGRVKLAKAHGKKGRGRCPG